MSIAADKRAARLFRLVAKRLVIASGACETEEEEELAEMYVDDAQDYKKVARMIDEHDFERAVNFHDGLDTASRECFFDFLTPKQAEWLTDWLEA